MIKAMLSALCFVLVLLPVGCSTDTAGQGTTPTLTPDQIASAINMGTASALTIGLPLIPDQVSTKADAKSALKVVTDLLDIIKGGGPGAVDALNRIMNLQAFSTCPYIQQALRLALPLLTGNFADKVTTFEANNIPPNVLKYTIAFLTGAQTGLQNYLGADASKVLAAPRDVTITVGTVTLQMSNLATQFARIQPKGMRK